MLGTSLSGSCKNSCHSSPQVHRVVPEQSQALHSPENLQHSKWNSAVRCNLSLCWSLPKRFTTQTLNRMIGVLLVLSMKAGSGSLHVFLQHKYSSYLSCQPAMAVLASPCLHKTGSQSLLFTCRVCVFVLYMTEAATWSARCSMTCCCTHGQPFARRNDILVVVKQGGVPAGTDLGATKGALLGRPRRRDSLSD